MAEWFFGWLASHGSLAGWSAQVALNALSNILGICCLGGAASPYGCCNVLTPSFSTTVVAGWPVRGLVG